VKSPRENTKFPQYRRYKNGLSYFKISSLLEFEEVKIVGNKRTHQQVVARQYPEKVFIHDLLFNYAAFAEEISDREYMAVSS
jgi:hypothetical protein